MQLVPWRRMAALTSGYCCPFKMRDSMASSSEVDPRNWLSPTRCRVKTTSEKYDVTAQVLPSGYTSRCAVSTP